MHPLPSPASMGSDSHVSLPERLPSELLARVMQYLPLDGLLIAMRVCSLWRALATKCDAYVSDIDLLSQKPSAVNLFLHRLECSGSRPSTLRIVVDSPWEAFSTVIVPAIAMHLSHVGEIIIRCVLPEVTTLISCLTGRPAPQLQAFHLYVAVEDTPELVFPKLPADLFANDAPCLRTLALTNVELGAALIPPVLSAVNDLTICYTADTGRLQYPHYLDINVWQHFISLSTLRLEGDLVLAHPAYFEQRSWRDVKRLHLALYPEETVSLLNATPFLRLLPLMEFYYPYPTSSMMEIMSHIPGPLDVIVIPSLSGCGEIRLTDRNTGRTRIFTAPWDSLFPSHVHAVLSADTAHTRMVSLTAASTVWLALSRMRMLYPKVDNLRMILQNNDNITVLSGATLHCTALRSFTLRSDYGTVFARRADVAAFYKTSLQFYCPECELVLENVVLHEPDDHIDALFLHVRYANPAGWSRDGGVRPVLY